MSVFFLLAWNRSRRNPGLSFSPIAQQPPKAHVSDPPGSFAWPGVLQNRLIQLVSLVAIELVAVSVWLDAANLNGPGSAFRIVRSWGPQSVRALAAFAIFSLVFGNSRRKRFPGIRPSSGWLRFSWTFAAAHLALLLVFCRLSSQLFGAAGASDVLLWSWVICGSAAAICGLLVFLPAVLWPRMIRGAGVGLVFAACAALGASLLTGASRGLWQPTSALTFAAVRVMLSGVIPNMVHDPAAFLIGGPRFSVSIAPECSGLEGIGLMLAFGCSWLWFFRREYRYPQALLLIPAGIVAIWLANALRIALLILIGEAGAASVALGGFHSQAGWIAFLGVALAFAAGSRRLPWFCKSPGVRDPVDSAAGNPSAAYLTPFLAILAAALVAQSASSGFEALYGLRFFAAAGALWFFRRQYRGLNWSASWMAAAGGAVVFVIWMAVEKIQPAGGAKPLGAYLAALSPPARMAWLFFRTAASITTVPLAEELAFRGFLMRRLMAADFESVNCQAFALGPFLISSVSFGVLHGDRWLAATIAGAVYAAIFLRRGSIGDAVAAHAVTNALLAAWVLCTGSWNLW